VAEALQHALGAGADVRGEQPLQGARGHGEAGGDIAHARARRGGAHRLDDLGDQRALRIRARAVRAQECRDVLDQLPGGRRPGQRALELGTGRAEQLGGGDHAVVERRHRPGDEPGEAARAELRADDRPGAREDMGRDAARHAVDEHARRLDRQVHARVGEDLLGDRRAVAVVPGHDPVLLDEVGDVGRRRDAHHAGDPHRRPRRDQRALGAVGHPSHFSKPRRAPRATMARMSTDTYALVELRELDDAAVAGGFSDTLEARFARDALGCERIGLSLQRLEPGARAPFAHCHSHDEEVYVVVAGDGRAIVEGEVVELRPWSALWVPPGSARSFAAGPDGLELLAFGTHTEGDQGEMVDPGWRV